MTTLKTALKAMMAAEGTERQSDARREAARAIVAERKKHTFDGRPDWFGKSRTYKDAINAAYRSVGMPSDSEDPKLHAGLRVGHINPVVREMAPHEDLEALRTNRKPREAPRSRSKTSENGNVPTRPTILSEVLNDPVGLVTGAIRALEAAKELKPTPREAETLRILLRSLWDAANELVEVVRDADL